MPIIPTPAGRSVRTVERGDGAPTVLLHGGLGSPAEWRPCMQVWPTGERLIAIDVYGTDDNPAALPGRTVHDYVDQVLGVVAHVGGPVHLVGYSWGGLTALQTAVDHPDAVATLSVIEPQAYGLLRGLAPDDLAEIEGLRDRWRARVAEGRWDDGFEELLDAYNGPGWFARWDGGARDAFLTRQRAMPDLWDVLFEAPLTVEDLQHVRRPTLVVGGGESQAVEHRLCEVVRSWTPRSRYEEIPGARHTVPLTHPIDLAAVLSTHVRSLSVTA